MISNLFSASVLLDVMEVVTFLAWGTFLLALLVICALAIHLMVIWGVFIIYRDRGLEREEAVQRLPLPDELPHVLIQLPTFNEPEVVERSLEAAAAIDWPRDRLHIQLLDDSTDETTGIAKAKIDELRARGLDAVLLHRENREGFKAGALKAGLEVSTAEYVAVFDADFVPPPDVLKRTLRPLINEKNLAFVQTRWEHANVERGLLTRAQGLMLDSHFGVEQCARSWAGLPMSFNGTGGVWRRAAIDDAGGWEGDTLTEDLDLSLRAAMRGWKSLYMTNLSIPSDLPESISAWRNQQFRWTKGFAQVAIKLLPSVLKSNLRPLHKFAVSVQLIQGWLYPAGLIAMLTALLAMVLTASQPWAILFLGLFATAMGATGVFIMVGTAQTVLKRRFNWLMLGGFASMLALNGGLALSNSRAIWEAMIGRQSAFVRTPKGTRGTADKARQAKKQEGLPELIVASSAAAIAVWDNAWFSPFFSLTVFGLFVVGAVTFASQRLR